MPALLIVLLTIDNGSSLLFWVEALEFTRNALIIWLKLLPVEFELSDGADDSTA